MMGRTTRFVIGLLLALALAVGAEEESLLLNVRCVPPPEQLMLGDQELPADPDYPGFRLPLALLPPSGSLTLEARAQGHESTVLEVPVAALKSHYERTPKEPFPWPAGESIAMLSPKLVEVTFHTIPLTRVSLDPKKGGRQLLGASDEPILIPVQLLAEAGNRLVLTRPGYRDLVVELEPGVTRWPQEGSAHLKPSVPLLVPLMEWLSTHTAATLVLTLLLVVGLLWVLKELRGHFRK